MRGYVMRLQGGDPTAAPNTGEGKACVAAQYLVSPSKLKLGVQRNVTNAASLVIQPSTGEILSMVGSLDYWNVAIEGNFNAALGQRQPGSAFKPFVYTDGVHAPPVRQRRWYSTPTTFNQVIRRIPRKTKTTSFTA
jgi:membrane peptidoglycan carboxypeptidase